MKVYRCRFVSWTPEGITACAFSPSGEHLAVVRNNGGDVEVWNTWNGYHMEKVIAGSGSVSIRGVCWAPGRLPGEARLFTGGDDAMIVEYDVKKWTVKETFESYGGAIWGMSADSDGHRIATACDDGCVRLFGISAGKIEYLRAFDPQPGRAVSVAWYKDDAALVTGSTDGGIRWYDVRQGRVLNKMVAGSLEGKSEPPVVWAVKVLSDGTVVSGDSIGNVQFWAGETGTLIQGFRNHNADVLSLAVASNETSVFAGGVDNKVVQFQLVKGGLTGRKWVYTASRRPHTHDVSVLTVGKTESGEEQLVSAGVDTKICVYPVKNFGQSSPTKVLPFPHTSVVQCAPSHRLMLLQNATSLELWRFGEGEASEGGSGIQVVKNHEDSAKLLHIETKTSRHIVCCALSPDAKWIAISDRVEMRLYELSVDADAGVASVRPVEDTGLPPCSVMRFSPDSKRLILGTMKATLQVYDLKASKVVRMFGQHQDDGAVVSCLAVSMDAQWLASGDSNNKVHVFNLDTLQYHATLPSFEKQFTCFSFHPSGSALVLATVSNKFFIYDVEDGQLTDWSREYSDKLPRSLLKKKEKIVGMTFNPADKDGIILYSHTYLCMVDLAKPMPHEDQTGRGERKRRGSHSGGDTGFGVKRRRMSESGDRGRVGDAGENYEDGEKANFRFVERYKPLLHAECVSENCLLIVERPWLRILQKLPDVLYRPRYGT